MNTKHDDGSLAQQFRQSACSVLCQNCQRHRQNTELGLSTGVYRGFRPIRCCFSKAVQI